MEQHCVAYGEERDSLDEQTYSVEKQSRGCVSNALCTVKFLWSMKYDSCLLYDVIEILTDNF